MVDFHVAKPDEIRAGKTTDVYFSRAKKVLEAFGLTQICVFLRKLWVVIV